MIRFICISSLALVALLSLPASSQAGALRSLQYQATPSTQQPVDTSGPPSGAWHATSSTPSTQKPVDAYNQLKAMMNTKFGAETCSEGTNSKNQAVYKCFPSIVSNIGFETGLLKAKDVPNGPQPNVIRITLDTGIGNAGVDLSNTYHYRLNGFDFFALSASGVKTPANNTPNQLQKILAPDSGYVPAQKDFCNSIEVIQDNLSAGFGDVVCKHFSGNCSLYELTGTDQSALLCNLPVEKHVAAIFMGANSIPGFDSSKFIPDEYDHCYPTPDGGLDCFSFQMRYL